MKKNILIMLILVLSLGMLFSCGSTDIPDVPTTPSDPTTPSEPTTPPPSYGVVDDEEAHYLIERSLDKMSEFKNTVLEDFKNVWVFCEQRQGVLMPTDFELISEGRKLADELGVKLCGLLLGDNIEGLAKELGGYGADKVYVYNSPLLKNYTTDAYTKVIVEVGNGKAIAVKSEKILAVVIAHLVSRIPTISDGVVTRKMLHHSGEMLVPLGVFKGNFYTVLFGIRYNFVKISII